MPNMLVTHPAHSVESAAAAVAHHGPCVSWLKDEEGRYVWASPAFAERFGLGDEPVVGRTDLDLLPANLAERARELDERVRASGQTVEALERDRAPSGDFRQWLVIRFPALLRRRPHVGAVAIDVTKLQREREEDEGAFRQILDAISDVVLVRGRQARVEWANQAFLDVYGISREQLKFVLDASFNEPDYTERGVRDDLVVFTTGRSLEIPEERVVRYDGTPLLFHTVKSPILDAAGQVIKSVSVSRDITASSRLEMELRQAQKLESVGRLAAGLAHEINTPIQYVGDQARFAQSAFVDVLRLCETYRAALDCAVDRPVAKEELERLRAAEEELDLDYVREHGPLAFAAILDGTARVAQLVRAMKEFGHPDGKAKELSDLNRIIRSTVTISANEVKYVADVATHLGELPSIQCYPGELAQVFLNLLVNAAHAIADVVAGTGLRGTITVTTRHEDGYVIASVADTGTGIPEELRGKIFDPFFTTKEVGRGTGQGLAIARMVIVEKHGGSLTFDTEVGRGTTFHVRLPVEPSDA